MPYYVLLSLSTLITLAILTSLVCLVLHKTDWFDLDCSSSSWPPSFKLTLKGKSCHVDRRSDATP